MLLMFAHDFFYGLQYFWLKQLPLIRKKIFFEEKISHTFGQNKGTNDLVFKKKKRKINEYKYR